MRMVWLVLVMSGCCSSFYSDPDELQCDDGGVAVIVWRSRASGPACTTTVSDAGINFELKESSCGSSNSMNPVIYPGFGACTIPTLAPGLYATNSRAGESILVPADGGPISCAKQ